MANKSPVHVKPRENGWAVVREGRERASSVHSTQSEAAKEGREIARREETEFFLHAQDGRVREHRSYGEEPHPAEKEAVGQAANTVDATTNEPSAPAHTSAAAGGATREAETDRPGGPTNAGLEDVTSAEETSGTEEVRGLTDIERDDRFGMPEERFAGYAIYDQDGKRIGKVDDLFIDEEDNPEYVGVRTGSSGTRSALIPADIVAVYDRLRRMVVSRPKGVVESGPSLGYDEDVTPQLEKRVHDHYGLATPPNTESKSGYGAYYPDDTERAEGERGGSGVEIPGAQAVPPEAGRVRNREDLPGPGILRDEDELRIRRSEEELEVETREREAGAVRVRKRVRTERERIRVPKKRVEVTVERVPIEGDAVSAEGEIAKPEIGEDEIVVPVIEEEIVVEKRPVVKEEIRIRKEVVEETEVVEENVRREEVEVDEESERGR
jgi:uncharacterized protein (TIGR02271 family)